ncbi:reverse transcriptase domain-containing protein [Tanacetum coccineum]
MDDTWQVHMNYSSLNKVCARDMYPFSNVEEKLGSLTGYQYKCYLQLPKEYSQVRMLESDEENTGFHTEERVYCFTHMSKGLKKIGAALQRMMDKVFTKQRGRNVEVCLEEIVIKSKTELDLVRDVEETLHKLQRVNVKIDPSKCTFGVDEGKFLGYVATTKGIKADPEKPAAARVGNLLHFNGESSADTNPHGKILKNNLPNIQSQRGNRCPHGRDAKIFRKEAEVKIVKTFFGQGEQVLQAPGRELNKEGSDVGMVLVDLEGKEYSHDVHLNFYASEDNMDYEALLVGLVAFTGRNMKDIHVFIGLKLLVEQLEGSRVPRTEEAKRYMEEIMDAIAPFHRFRITYLPNVLNPKAEALTGLAYIRLELLNQEVSMGVKTRPLVEAQDKLQEKERNTSKKPASRKLSPGWEDCSGSN